MLIFACTLPGELIVSAHEVGVCILRYIYTSYLTVCIILWCSDYCMANSQFFKCCNI